MSKRNIVSIVVAVLVMSLAVVATSIARDKGPAEMTLQTADAKKPANFPHAKHQEKYGCDTCHHYMDAEGNQAPCTGDDDPIQKCESCHNKDFKDVKLNSFKNAAHAQCKECHKKEGGNAPTKCTGCHPKKK